MSISPMALGLVGFALHPRTSPPISLVIPGGQKVGSPARPMMGLIERVTIDATAEQIGRLLNQSQAAVEFCEGDLRIRQADDDRGLVGLQLDQLLQDLAGSLQV